MGRHLKGWPYKYGFYGMCEFCPANKRCDEGRHCQIFTNLTAPGRPQWREAHRKGYQGQRKPKEPSPPPQKMEHGWLAALLGLLAVCLLRKVCRKGFRA